MLRNPAGDDVLNFLFQGGLNVSTASAIRAVYEKGVQDAYKQFSEDAVTVGGAVPAAVAEIGVDEAIPLASGVSGPVPAI